MSGSSDQHGRQFRTLLRAFLVLDLHNPSFARATGAKPGEAISPLFWVIGQHLLIGLITSFVLFTRVDAAFFAWCHLVLGMLAVVSALAVELHEVVASAADWRILGALPVRGRTVALARLANLGIYLVAITLSLHLVPAIVGCGLRDAGWQWLPAYAIAALISTLLAAGATVLVLAVLLRGRLAERARDALAWTQILLILLLFYGGQALLRDAGHRLERFAADLPSWIWLTPPGQLARWCADACADAGTPPLALGGWIPLAGIAVAGGLWLTCWWRLSRGHAAITADAAESDELPPLRRAGRLGTWFDRLVMKDPVERTGAWLTRTMLLRDPQIRLRALPALSMPFAPLLLGLFWHRLGDPLREGDDANLTLAAVYLVVLPVPAMVNALSGSRDADAAWILRAAPLDGADRDRLLRGMLQTITLVIALPTAVLLIAVLAWEWHALTDPLLLAAASVACAHLAGVLTIHLLGKRLPCSRPFVRGETLGPVAMATGVMSAMAMGLALVQHALIHSRTAMVVLIIVLVLLGAIAQRWLLPHRRSGRSDGRS